MGSFESLNLAMIEGMVQRLFVQWNFNISEYLHPAQHGSAPFYALHLFLKAVKEQWSSAFEKPSEGPVKQIKDAIDRNEVLPPVNIDDNLHTMVQQCSTIGMSLELAAIAVDHQSMAEAYFLGDSSHFAMLSELVNSHLNK